MAHMVAYVGRNGIWPNTVTCDKHSTKENWDRHCRVMSAMNTTAWPEHVETELPCVFCEQVTMAAELNQPASQAAEHIPELDVELEQDVAK